MLGCAGNDKDCAKIVQREIPFCWSDWLIFYWSGILDLSGLMYLFLFYPILDYSFSYEHFNTTSSIGQPRKPVSNGLHQEYSSSFWLWLYTGKTRNHCFILLWGGTHQFTFICQNVAGFFLLLLFDFLEDGHEKSSSQHYRWVNFLTWLWWFNLF